MNQKNIENLLLDFVANTTMVQGAVVVSRQGQPLTHPIGISENSTHIIAGTMLHLAGCISEQCQWPAIDWVTIQALEGYLILTQCYQELFLLIQTSHAPAGFLQSHIRQCLDKLRASIHFPGQDSPLVQLSYQPTELIPNSTGMDDVTTAAGYHPVSDPFSQFSMAPESIENVAMATAPGANGTADLQSSPRAKRSQPPSTSMCIDALEIANCYKELTQVIGPMASLICDRTLAQNPQVSLIEFVHSLSEQIPDKDKALDFQRRILIV